MRLATIAAATALFAGLLTQSTPALAAQPVVSCTPSVTAAATRPTGGAVAVAVVATAYIRVQCSIDALQTPPADWVTGWSGHAGGLIQSVNYGWLDCTPDTNYNTEYPAVGTELVMTVALSCTVPTDSLAYTDDLYLQFGWLISGPGWSSFQFGPDTPISRV
jgi:hypothetical protein